MSARNRVFIILALLTIGSLIWYLVTVRPTGDLQLIGTVDANEVLVNARIAGRIQTLTVKEGDYVKAGQVIAVIESDDLDAALKAAEATALSLRSRFNGNIETQKQNTGETQSATASAEAQIKVAEASVAQAKANLQHQQAETTRTVALAQQGIMSAQSRDETETALQASEAAVTAAESSLAAAQAAFRQARAHELLAAVSEHTVASSRADVANARAMADQARIEKSYAEVVSPVNGRVAVWAARQGEVVTMGETIVSIMDLTQTWVYAPLPETQADTVKLGDSLRVVMPSGGTIQGRIINKSAQADFATQRDVSARKRDIKTIQLKMLIDNPDEKYVPGMTAEVYIPKDRLVKQ